MKTISVHLNDKVEGCLYKLMQENDCTISDVVNIAILTLAQEPKLEIIKPDTLWNSIKREIEEKTGISIKQFCEEKQINYHSFYNLCTRLEKGSLVYGFGGKNKWRDKQDERLYKTHTSYIVHCIKTSCDIDLENYKKGD